MSPAELPSKSVMRDVEKFGSSGPVLGDQRECVIPAVGAP
jgi:hypothetical protein